MAYFAKKPIQTLQDGYMILVIFPFSIVFVAFLEGPLGLA